MQYLQKKYIEVNWLIFYFIIVISWTFVFLMILASNSVEGVENFYGSDFLATLCQPIYKISDWPYAFLMWSIMGIAMMVPTIYPTLKTYDDLSNLNNVSNLGFASIIVGFIYLIGWINELHLTVVTALSTYVIPISIIPIVIRAFFDSRTAIFTTVSVILITGYIVPNSFEFVVLNFIACFFAIFSTTSLSRKGSLVFLLTKIGKGTPQDLCLEIHQSGRVSIIALILAFPFSGKKAV